MSARLVVQKNRRIAAALGFALCITAIPVSVLAGSVTLSAGTLSVSGGGPAILLVPGAGGSAAAGPLLPVLGGPGAAPVSAAAPILAAPSAGSAAAQGDAGGVDQKWGDPLSAHVIDEDGVQGGFNYFYGSSLGGNAGGVGFSLTFKN